MLEKHYAKFHHSAIGGSVEIIGRPFSVVGLLEIKEGAQIASSNIYLSLRDAQNFLGGESNGVNILYLRLKNPSLLSQVKSKHRRSRSTGFRSPLRFIPGTDGRGLEDF